MSEVFGQDGVYMTASFSRATRLKEAYITDEGMKDKALLSRFTYQGDYPSKPVFVTRLAPFISTQNLS